jgi:hypothetical protein
LPRQPLVLKVSSDHSSAAYIGAACIFRALPDRIAEKIIAFSCAISYMKKCYSDFYYTFSYTRKCLYMVIKIKLYGEPIIKRLLTGVVEEEQI